MLADNQELGAPMLDRWLVFFALVFAGNVQAAERSISVATWNLGWHVDLETAKVWITECGKKFVKDPSTNRWNAATGDEGTVAWDIDGYSINGWDHTRFPVCGVYYDGKTVRVTPSAYKERQQRTADFIRTSLSADVIAFQEVSGIQAVKEILPGGGADFDLCEVTPASDYKVQRLVIAWKKTLGSQVSCETEESLALRNNPERFQPRPGLAVTLNVDGRLLRILAVHLKSSCVSPLGGGDLAGSREDCEVLQQQIDPLEAWVESNTADEAKVVLLGDFNRNLFHELRDQTPVRTDLSSPADTRQAGALSRSLLEEVADGKPATSDLSLVNEECVTDIVGKMLCVYGETRSLTPAERSLLGSASYLGCWNPVGLDHILVGPGFKVDDLIARHIGIGTEGATKAGRDDGSDQRLAISDHCPLTVDLTF